MARTALLIPGRAPVHQSLLTFAEEAIDRRRGEVRRIWWTPPGDRGLDDLVPWVRAEVEAELDRLHPECPLLVGKSLGTLSAPVAAERELPAIWFTPVLHEDRFAELYEKQTAPRLFVGGTGDAMWDGDLARQLSPYVLEVEGADHGMFVPGPLAESGRVHGEVGAAIERFLDEVVWPSNTA